MSGEEERKRRYRLGPAVHLYLFVLLCLLLFTVIFFSISIFFSCSILVLFAFLCVLLFTLFLSVLPFNRFPHCCPKILPVCPSLSSTFYCSVLFYLLLAHSFYSCRFHMVLSSLFLSLLPFNRFPRRCPQNNSCKSFITFSRSSFQLSRHPV